MPQIRQYLTFIRAHLLQTLSLIILIMALIMTWLLFQSKHQFPESTHLGIQEEFQKIIVERLLKKNPLIENVSFKELWTETTNQSKQIRAVFSYTFTDPSQESEDAKPVKVTVSGSALINQEPSSKDIEKWKIGPFDVSQTELDFENEVIMIVPEEKSDENQDEEEPSTSNHLKMKNLKNKFLKFIQYYT